MAIKIKRIYEKYESGDGFRVLVDRLWPRGVKKENAHIDLWLKDVGPSNELRKWFGHEHKKWTEFKKKYKQELKDKKDLLDGLKGFEKEHRQITLLFSAKDEKENQAVVIKELLK